MGSGVDFFVWDCIEDRLGTEGAKARLYAFSSSKLICRGIHEHRCMMLRSFLLFLICAILSSSDAKEAVQHAMVVFKRKTEKSDG